MTITLKQMATATACRWTNVDGFGFVAVYGKSDRTDKQSIDGYGSNAEVWSLAAK